MTKHLSDDRPPAYDSQIFFPPEIKHHKKDQNASLVSVIYFKTASLLFICSAFMLWFSIYTAWQLFYVTNMAMVNPNSLWWVHMGISLKERQITEEPMKVKIWKKLLIHKHLV